MARKNVRLRASAVIIKGGKILLVHRRKNGYEYWVLPGGGIEEGETGEEAVAREVKEETNIDCSKVSHAFDTREPETGIMHPVYFCEAKEGKLALVGPEVIKQSDKDWYNPEWVNIKLIKKINILPVPAREKLIKIIKT